jgi:hypothetical protein
MVIDKAGSAEIHRDSGLGEVLIVVPGQPAGTRARKRTLGKGNPITLFSGSASLRMTGLVVVSYI